MDISASFIKGLKSGDNLHVKRYIIKRTVKKLLLFFYWDVMQ